MQRNLDEKRKMRNERLITALAAFVVLSTMNVAAQNKRLSVGGYGEAVFSRNYYSDHVSRYSQPEEHKNDPSHGRFDIPHAVVYLGYDFGKGWSVSTEIEFEHGGNGIAWNSSGFRNPSHDGLTCARDI